MGTCFLYGSGGSGALLIRVVGGLTQPANPTYGTIWLQTDVPILGWEIFPRTPTWDYYDGHVYIQTVPATHGEIPNFSAIDMARKPNGAIWLQLAGAVQRINGEWVRLNGYMWRDGVWTQFSTHFSATINVTYPAGSTCTATDGTTTLTAPDTAGTWECIVPNAGAWTFGIGKSGWERIATITESGQTANLTIDGVALFEYGRQKYTWSAVAMRQSGSAEVQSEKPTLTNNDDGSLTITLSKTSSGMLSGGVMIDSDIDFSGISTLSIEFEESKTVSGSSNSSYLDVIPRTASDIDSGLIAGSPLTGKTSPLSIDTSSVTGKYAAIVQLHINTYAVGTGAVSIKIKRIIGR